MDLQPIVRPRYAPITATTTTAALKEVIQLPIHRGDTLELDVAFVGIRSTGVPNFLRRTIRVYNSSVGVPSLISSSIPIPDDSPGGYAIDVSFVGENVSISVQGAAGQTVTWEVSLLALG